MTDDADNLAALRDVECFAGPTDAELARLDGHLARRVLAAGEVIIREDDQDSAVFVLLSGRASIRMAFREGETPDMADIAPGDLFGEMALLTGHPRSATVTAREPSTVIEIAAAGMEALIRGRPDVKDQIRRIMAERQADNLKTVMGLANERPG